MHGACLVAAVLRVFAYSPVSHYALVGLAIGRSLYVSNVSYFVFLFEGTGLLAVLSHVNKLAILCCAHNN